MLLAIFKHFENVRLGAKKLHILELGKKRTQIFAAFQVEFLP